MVTREQFETMSAAMPTEAPSQTPVEAAATDLYQKAAAYERALRAEREAQTALESATTDYEQAFEHFRSAISQAAQGERR